MRPATQQRTLAPTTAVLAKWHSRRRSITAQRKRAAVPLLSGVGFGTVVGGGVGGGVPGKFLGETLTVFSLYSGLALEGSGSMGKYIFIFVVRKVLARMFAT